MRSAPVIGMSALLCLAAAAGAHPMDDPFGYFGVYSLGDIGTSSAKYHSDFQGVAGAAGSVYFSSFSLHGRGSTTGFSLHTGGSATLTGSYTGSLEIGRDAHLGGLSVGGDGIAGGNIDNFSGGHIRGDAIAGGQVSLSGTMTVGGEKRSGAAFDPQVDHAALSAYFRDRSTEIGQMAATGSVTNEWGNLIFTGESGVNVVNVDADTLKKAWGFSITAPDDAVVYVNVLDEDVKLDWTGWCYRGGITAGDVLLNMPNAENLKLSSSNTVNLLAPFAETQFNSGLLSGTLVVGDLTGGGQVNLGDFDHGGAVPEPATLAILALGALPLIRRRRRA